MEPVFLVLRSKRQVGEGSILMCGGSVVTKWDPL